MLINPVDIRLAERDLEALIDAVMNEEITCKNRLRRLRDDCARRDTPLKRQQVESAERRLAQFEDIYRVLLRAMLDAVARRTKVVSD